MKSDLHIYSEEANSASVDLETAWQFSTYKNIKIAMQKDFHCCQQITSIWKFLHAGVLLSLDANFCCIIMYIIVLHKKILRESAKHSEAWKKHL
ncbi:hypothetical protein T4D_1336 [Trichinella pseudospiralis]|uniref:Uncharacterized protein n=1 Tax=Trichinella pseudospiralis TaxID=6337 RepID=A0A0V1FGR2_TRIPS|nr:hypothetical protein T4D_1336 [Trichinella pseudospiralis]